MALNLFPGRPEHRKYGLITFSPSPIQAAWIESKAVICVLVGPQGEGKTWAGAVALVHHAQHWKSTVNKKLRAAIIRDTHENIKRMTVPSINEALGPICSWKSDFKKLELVDGSLDLDLMGMDDEASLTKLQGAEYGLVWLEEPAPILDRANAGLSVNVFNTALTRVARQIRAEYQAVGIMPRLQVTMNPADEGHWTFSEFIENPRFPSEDFPDVTLEVYNIPYGENAHLSDISRQTTKAGYSKDPGLFARYVSGQWSFVMSGKAVTPNYNPDLHRAKVKLNPMPGLPLIRGWDGGLNPTCVIAQVFPTGRIAFLDTLLGENMGMRQFIKLYVKPCLANRYKGFNREMWTDVGDPTLANRDQSDSDQWASKIIEEELGATFLKGEKDWAPRRESWLWALSQNIDGGPMVILSNHEGRLHRGLRGGWHYPTDNNGRVTNDKPVKDIHSHPCDAGSYVLAKILGFGGEIEKPRRRPQRYNPFRRRPNWRTV